MISPSTPCACGKRCPSRRRNANISGSAMKVAPRRGGLAHERFRRGEVLGEVVARGELDDGGAHDLGVVDRALRRAAAELGRIDAGAPDHVVEVLAVLLRQPRRAADVAVAAAQEADHIAALECALGVLERGDLLRRRGDRQRLGRDRTAAGETQRLVDPLGELARVAGPRLREQRRARFAREAHHLDARLCGGDRRGSGSRAGGCRRVRSASGGISIAWWGRSRSAALGSGARESAITRALSGIAPVSPSRSKRPSASAFASACQRSLPSRSA